MSTRRAPPAPSGDRLDAIYVLAGTGQWLMLATWGLVLAGLLGWAVFGRLHYRVDGMGVVLHEHGAVYVLAAQASGNVREARVRLGSEVELGDVLMVLDLPVDEAELKGRLRAAEGLSHELAQLHLATDAEAVDFAAATDRGEATQRQRLANADTQAAGQRQNLRAQQEERRLGYVTRLQVQQTQSQVFAAEQAGTDAQAQLAQFASKRQQFADQKRQALLDLERQLSAARAQLEETESRIASTGTIRATTAGRIVGTSVLPGAQVQAGQTVLSIERRSAGLEVLAFFPVSQGKAIAAGMRAEVSPTYIEREIYGSLLAEVAGVSDFAVDLSEVRSRVGDSDLVGALTQQGPMLQTRLRLARDAPGDGAGDGGLRWSSAKAPPFPVRTGALASVSVTTAEIRPIELLVPLFSTWIRAPWAGAPPLAPGAGSP